MTFSNKINGIIVEDSNNLIVNKLDPTIYKNYDFLSVYADNIYIENVCQIIQNSHKAINLRCCINDQIIDKAISLKPDSITIVADKNHILEYSFGVDVLKFKQILCGIISKCHSNNIRCGVSTDFRHENILHAGDCGADFVELDYCEFDNYKDQYELADEIATERDLQIIKKVNNILN